MNSSRPLLLATVASVTDSAVVYASCPACNSKLLIDQNTDRWVCAKCGFQTTDDKVTRRFRLPLKITEDQREAAVTVFGTVLEPFFGITANGLHRYLNYVESTLRIDKEKLMKDALRTAFVGNLFLFGFQKGRPPWKVHSHSSDISQYSVLSQKVQNILSNTTAGTNSANITNFIKIKETDRGTVATQMLPAHEDQRLVTVVEALKHFVDRITRPASNSSPVETNISLLDDSKRVPVSQNIGDASVGGSSSLSDLSSVGSFIGASRGHPSILLSCDDISLISSGTDSLIMQSSYRNSVTHKGNVNMCDNISSQISSRKQSSVGGSASGSQLMKEMHDISFSSDSDEDIIPSSIEAVRSTNTVASVFSMSIDNLNLIAPLVEREKSSVHEIGRDEYFNVNLADLDETLPEGAELEPSNATCNGSIANHTENKENKSYHLVSHTDNHMKTDKSNTAVSDTEDDTSSLLLHDDTRSKATEMHRKQPEVEQNGYASVKVECLSTVDPDMLKTEGTSSDKFLEAPDSEDLDAFLANQNSQKSINTALEDLPESEDLDAFLQAMENDPSMTRNSQNRTVSNPPFVAAQCISADNLKQVVSESKQHRDRSSESLSETPNGGSTHTSAFISSTSSPSIAQINREPKTAKTFIDHLDDLLNTMCSRTDNNKVSRNTSQVRRSVHVAPPGTRRTLVCSSSHVTLSSPISVSLEQANLSQGSQTNLTCVFQRASGIPERRTSSSFVTQVAKTTPLLTDECDQSSDVNKKRNDSFDMFESQSSTQNPPETIIHSNADHCAEHCIAQGIQSKSNCGKVKENKYKATPKATYKSISWFADVPRISKWGKENCQVQLPRSIKQNLKSPLLCKQQSQHQVCPMKEKEKESQDLFSPVPEEKSGKLGSWRTLCQSTPILQPYVPRIIASAWNKSGSSGLRSVSRSIQDCSGICELSNSELFSSPSFQSSTSNERDVFHDKIQSAGKLEVSKQRYSFPHQNLNSLSCCLFSDDSFPS